MKKIKRSNDWNHNLWANVRAFVCVWVSSDTDDLKDLSSPWVELITARNNHTGAVGGNGITSLAPVTREMCLCASGCAFVCVCVWKEGFWPRHHRVVCSSFSLSLAFCLPVANQFSLPWRPWNPIRAASSLKAPRVLVHLSVCIRKQNWNISKRGCGLRERKGGTKDKKWEDGGRRKIKKREWDTTLKKKLLSSFRMSALSSIHMLCIFCCLTLLSHQCSVL